jgi:PAS domain S-box-containing protein
MPHEKAQGAASSFDNTPNHSRLGPVERATFMLERAVSQLRGLVGSAHGTRNLHMPVALSVLLVLAVYYAGSIVGIQLGLPPSGIGAIWPPTAILLAALFLAPPRYCWMYLLGVVPTHLHVVANFQVPEVPVVVMLCQVGSNILLALLAAFALRSLIGAPPRLTNLRNMGAFILLAGVVATAVASAVTVWLFLLNGWATDFWPVWRQRVLANVFPIITIPPVIVQAFAGQLVGATATWRSYLEFAPITLGVLVVGIPIFGLDSPGPSNLPALLLAPLPFLIWAAVRVGVGGTGLTLLIVAGVALTNAYVGRGPFINQAPGVNVLSLQIFLTAISIPILLLAAFVEERQQEAESLKQTSKQAELALAERDALLTLAGKTARVGSYVKDIETGKMQVSPGYAVIHGLPEGTSETTVEDWRARVHPDDLGRLDASRNGVVAERRPEHNAEYRIIGTDGSVRWIEARALISYGDDGRVQRTVGINIDVTGRKRGEEHQRLLIAELDHRVKNVLASVAVVARRTSERRSSTSDFIEVLDDRLQSMADAHALLSRSRWQGVSLADLVHQQLEPFATSGNTMVEGPSVDLSAAATQAMAMVLHELATNAAKYGALSTPQGRVSVRWGWRSNGGALAALGLVWHEEGGPVVTVPVQTGYGASVIRDLIPYELGGMVELEYSPDGVRCAVVLPGEQTRQVDQAANPCTKSANVPS